jgi:putative phosphoribosyl transferase
VRRAAAESEKDPATNTAQRIALRNFPGKRAISCSGAGRASSPARSVPVSEQYPDGDSREPFDCRILLALSAAANVLTDPAPDPMAGIPELKVRGVARAPRPTSARLPVRGSAVGLDDPPGDGQAEARAGGQNRPGKMPSQESHIARPRPGERGLQPAFGPEQEGRMAVRERFRDRADAGRRLAHALAAYSGRPDVLVLALPRGGMPVAYEVAHGLGVPLDVFLVRKLLVPGREELTMGAIAAGGIRVLHEEVIRELGLPDDTIARAAADQQQELERRERAYRRDRREPAVEGRTAIVIDEGMVTGSTMRVAVAALRARNPARLVVAVPVAPAAACAALRDMVDEVVCTLTPEPFHRLGAWYEEQAEISDHEVRELLERADRELVASRTS